MISRQPGPLEAWIKDNATYSFETRPLRTPGFSLISVDQPADEYARHAGDELNLQLCIGGTGSAEFAHGDHQANSIVQDGTLFLSPTNVDLRYRTSGHHRILVMAMQKTADGVAEALDGRLDFGLLHERTWKDPLIARLLSEMWEQTQAQAAADRLFADGSRLLILSKLAVPGARAFQAVGGLAPWQIRRATEALKSLLAENVSLSDIASEVGLSPFHFSRAFKYSVGMPPHRYRTRLRLERACELLETTDVPVTEIALTVGYESSQSLARVFAREFGVTPTQWRRERCR